MKRSDTRSVRLPPGYVPPATEKSQSHSAPAPDLSAPQTRAPLDARDVPDQRCLSMPADSTRPAARARRQPPQAAPPSDQTPPVHRPLKSRAGSAPRDVPTSTRTSQQASLIESTSIPPQLRPGLDGPVKTALQIAAARSSKKNAPIDSSQTNVTIMTNAGSLHAVIDTPPVKRTLMAARDMAIADTTHSAYHKKAVQHGYATGAQVKATVEKASAAVAASSSSSSASSGASIDAPASTAIDARAATTATSKTQFREPQDLNTTDRKLFYHAIDGHGSAIQEPLITTSTTSSAVAVAARASKPPQRRGAAAVPDTDAPLLDAMPDNALLDISPSDMIMGTSSRQIDVDVDRLELPGKNAKREVIALLNPNALPGGLWREFATENGPDAAAPMDVDAPADRTGSAVESDRMDVVTAETSHSAALINVALHVGDGDTAPGTRSKRRRRDVTASGLPMEDEDEEELLLRASRVHGDSERTGDPDAMQVDTVPTRVGVVGDPRNQALPPRLKKAAPSSDCMRLDPSDLATAADCEVYAHVASRKKQLMLKSSDVSKAAYDSIRASSDTPGLVQSSPMEVVARTLQALFGTKNTGGPSSIPALHASEPTTTITSTARATLGTTVLAAAQDTVPEVYFAVNEAKRVAASFGMAQRLSIFTDKLNQFFVEQTHDDVASFLSLFDAGVLERLSSDPAVRADPALLTGGVDLSTWMYEFSKRKNAPEAALGSATDTRSRQNTFLQDQQHHANVVSTLARFSPVYRAIEEQEAAFKARDSPCYSNRQEQLTRDLLEAGELPECPTVGKAYIEAFQRSYRPAQVLARNWFYCDRGLDCVCRQIGTSQAGGSIFVNKTQPGFTFGNASAASSRSRLHGVSVGVNVTASGASVISTSIDERRMRTLIHTNVASGATHVVSDALARRAVAACFRPSARAAMSAEAELQLAQFLCRSNGGVMELEAALRGELAPSDAENDKKDTAGWNLVDGFIGVQFLLPSVNDAVRTWSVLPGEQRGETPNPGLAAHGLCYYCYVQEVNRRDCELTQGMSYTRRKRGVNVNLHPTNGHFLPLNAFQVKVDCADGYPRDSCISTNVRSPGKSAIVGHFPIFMLNDLIMQDEGAWLRIIDTGSNFLLS